MMSRLRALERAFVLERMAIALEPVVNEIVDRFRRAVTERRSPPDPLELLDLLREAGLYVPGALRAINYLEDCTADGRPLDAKTLFQTLLPEAPNPFSL